MAFDYFYGAQSQQFAFYRIPKVLFTDNRFQNISTEGKVLYGLLLDRVSLSIENGWIDDEGRVYIIFTLTTIRQAMNCAEKSAIKYLTELEEFSLIERIRQGFGKPALIYVKNFIDQQNLQVKTGKNYSSPPVKVTGQDLYNLQPNYTYNNNTDFNNTNPILSADEDRMGYEKYFMEQLNIEALKQDYPYDREIIDGIMELILDVVCSKRKYLLPTHKGVALITVMPEQIQSPSMTAEWEQKLLDVEKGAFRDAEFMNEIEGMITELVRTYKIIEDAEVLMHPVLEEIGTCPCCGRHVVERQKGYSCENRQCNFVLWKQNRFFEALGKKMTKPIAVKLLSDGKVTLKGCKSKKTGKTYDTTVIMTVDENQRAVFELNFEKGAGKYGKSKNKKD